MYHATYFEMLVGLSDLKNRAHNVQSSLRYPIGRLGKHDSRYVEPCIHYLDASARTHTHTDTLKSLTASIKGKPFFKDILTWKEPSELRPFQMKLPVDTCKLV
jgi:hypothetical protein